MKKILSIIFFSLLFYNFSFAIDLSEYSAEEQKQYKEIKKLKEKGFTGKNYLKEEFWIKDKKNFYHNIAAFHTGITGLRIKNKTMPTIKKTGDNTSNSLI